MAERILIQVKVDDELKTKFHSLCVENKTTMREVTEELIREWVKNNEHERVRK